VFTNKSEEMRISLGEERISNNIKFSRWDAPIPKLRIKTGVQRMPRNYQTTKSWVNSESAILMAKGRTPSNVM